MMAASLGESRRKLTPQGAYLILLCSLPILIVFALLGKIWLGFGAWICSGLVMLVVRTRWDLRKHVWFWIAIVFAELLQIPIVLLIPWRDRNLTWIVFLPVAVLDFGLVYGCIKSVEKMMKRHAGTSSAN
jgi:hypothetical protein